MFTNAVTSLPELPENTKPIIEEMGGKEPQGASRRIRQINNLFVAIAEGWFNEDGSKLVDTILKVGSFFISTRGKNTPAISNAVYQTLNGINEKSGQSVCEIQEFITKRRDLNNTSSIDKSNRIGRLGANLFKGLNVIMPFDFSGTVMGILRTLHEDGLHKQLIVPESRAISGGIPILKQALSLGHSVRYIVDLAAASFMDEVEAVIIGSETIFSNGDCWNTIGGYTIAMIAHQQNTPFFVATDLMKIDPYSYQGIKREIKVSDFISLLQPDEQIDNLRNVSYIAPDLDLIPAKLITAYITEKGVLPPHCIYSEAHEFLEEIGALSTESTNEEEI